MRQWQVAAGLIYGQVKKSYRRRRLARVTPVMRLGTEAALTAALMWEECHVARKSMKVSAEELGGSLTPG